MPLLFRHDAILAPLGSGSRGNCTYIGDDTRGVLVDCGLSARQTLLRLEAAGLGAVRIEGVLVTHEHGDHVAAARVLSDRLERRQGHTVPFFMTRGTAGALRDRVRPKELITIQSGRRFRVGSLEVEPFTVPHDTCDPVAYTVKVGDTVAAVVTDLGRSTRLVEQQLARCSLALIEFNHDLGMLMDGPYPWALKQRVRGRHGHLSNAQAAELVRRAATPRLEHLLLAHLSDDNNEPAVAREAAEAALHGAGLRGVTVTVAPQDRPADVRRAEVEVPQRARQVAGPRRPRIARGHRPPDDASRQVSLFG
ncbi:MAG: phosphoribosyl 1,2-cyclic phosphodiesterase [Myxococcota bacterium]